MDPKDVVNIVENVEEVIVPVVIAVVYRCFRIIIVAYQTVTKQSGTVIIENGEEIPVMAVVIKAQVVVNFAEVGSVVVVGSGMVELSNL